MHRFMGHVAPYRLGFPSSTVASFSALRHEAQLPASNCRILLCAKRHFFMRHAAPFQTTLSSNTVASFPVMRYEAPFPEVPANGDRLFRMSPEALYSSDCKAYICMCQEAISGGRTCDIHEKQVQQLAPTPMLVCLTRFANDMQARDTSNCSICRPTVRFHSVSQHAITWQQHTSHYDRGVYDRIMHMHMISRSNLHPGASSQERVVERRSPDCFSLRPSGGLVNELRVLHCNCRTLCIDNGFNEQPGQTTEQARIDVCGHVAHSLDTAGQLGISFFAFRPHQNSFSQSYVDP